MKNKTNKPSNELSDTMPNSESKTIVHQFYWDGPGSVPSVTMSWEGQMVNFNVPIAMMEAYLEKEQQHRELLEALKELYRFASTSETNTGYENALDQAEQAIKKAT